MKLAYSTRIFRLRPLAEAINAIAEAGFHAVELLADRPHAYPGDINGSEATALNHCMHEHKMHVTNLNSCSSMVLGDSQHPSWIEEDWLEREKRIRYTLDCMRLAAAMGIPSISTSAGGGIPESMHQGEAWRLLVANMHRVGPLAKRLGVKLLLQSEPDMLLYSSGQMLQFLDELEYSEFLGINFNVAHLYCVGEDPCEAWDLLKNYVAHVQLSDVPSDRTHRHVQLGEGAVDIEGFLACVQESQYLGYVTIEMESDEQNPAGKVGASADYLRAKGFMPAKES